MTDFNTNDTMVEMFLFETAQLLEQLEQVILSSDMNNYYSEENINEVFRIMHTIKGSSAMMMYNEISVLSHAIEDLFFYLREENPEQNFCSSLNDLILDCVDFIKVELEKIRNHDDVDGDATNLVNKIKDFLSELKKNSGSNVSNEHYEVEKVNLFKAVIFFEEGCEMENIRAYSVIHNLKKVASEVIYYPQNILDDDGSVEVIRREGFKIHLKTDKTKDEVYNHLMDTVFLRELEFAEIDEETFSEGFDKEVFDYSSSEISLQDANYEEENNNQEGNILHKPDENVKDSQEEEKLHTDMRKINLEEEKKQPNAENHNVMPTQNIISVSVAKLDKLLDKLMDLVGELVIAEAMVLQNPDLEGLELDNFQKSARQLSKITDEIQDMVMSVRMIPLSATFQRMNRIVRDMCRKLNKEIQLEIKGEETEVDKNIIERITDPLMHLVRNAVDHGIETADERQLKGKPKHGTITLEAKNVSSDVHIIVRDDGRGLDKNKILRKARQNGLITMDEADMSDSEIYKLVLLPGFSTNENVTEFSGRGVGMDVVAKNIESIGGSISIQSEENKGTQMTLKIPLTLAIIDGMNLKVGKSTFTIPTITIKESFRTNKESIIVDPDGNEMIMVRGECYPIIRLNEFFKVETDVTDISDGIITMVSQDGNAICVFADRLLGQQQVVVKSLPEYIKRFKHIKGIAGCTLLGDGSISLILDIASLIHIK